MAGHLFASSEVRFRWKVTQIKEIWIMMQYFPGFYNYTGGASVWEEAEARSNFFVWVARSWWMFLRDGDHSEIVKNWFCYAPHKKSTNRGNKSYPLYEIDFVLQIDDFIEDGWFVKVQKAKKMYNGKMKIYLDWLPGIHHNQQARKYPCGVNDESLTHSVPLRVVIELLGQLRC